MTKSADRCVIHSCFVFNSVELDHVTLRSQSQKHIHQQWQIQSCKILYEINGNKNIFWLRIELMNYWLILWGTIITLNIFLHECSRAPFYEQMSVSDGWSALWRNDLLHICTDNTASYLKKHLYLYQCVNSAFLSLTRFIAVGRSPSTPRREHPPWMEASDLQLWSETPSQPRHTSPVSPVSQCVRPPSSLPPHTPAESTITRWDQTQTLKVASVQRINYLYIAEDLITACLEDLMWRCSTLTFHTTQYIKNKTWLHHITSLLNPNTLSFLSTPPPTPPWQSLVTEH